MSSVYLRNSFHPLARPPAKFLNMGVSQPLCPFSYDPSECPPPVRPVAWERRT